MKIKINDEDFLEISEVQRKVICNDINCEEFEIDIKQRLKYILSHKYERCLERLKQEWIPKLKNRVDSIPTDDEKLAQMIFSQPDYKDRKKRDEESASDFSLRL